MKLIINSSRVYGSRYHTVKPELDEWTEVFWKDGAHTWRNMLQWCVETFGVTPEDGVWTPNARWYSNNARFYFRNEEDMTLFILRWS